MSRNVDNTESTELRFLLRLLLRLRFLLPFFLQSATITNVCEESQGNDISSQGGREGSSFLNPSPRPSRPGAICEPYGSEPSDIPLRSSSPITVEAFNRKFDPKAI